MVNQILAIDISQRIPRFLHRIGQYAHKVCIAAKDAESAMLTVSDSSLIEIILVSIYQPLTKEFLRRYPNLRYIGVLGTNTSNLAIDYCQDKGIKVLNVTQYCDIETAEWVMLQIMKHFRERAERRSVNGKSLGVVGAGSVGKHMIELAWAFGMKVYYNAKNPQPNLSAIYLSKEQLFATCDVVSCHTPPQTMWLTADMLGQAKLEQCIINTCMGRLSPGQELEDFLKSRQDVTLIMDKVAGDSYRELNTRARIAEEPAFFTLDSEQKLVDRFFVNLGNMK